MPSFFPSTGSDELTKVILDSTGHYVYPRYEKPKFIPYEEDFPVDPENPEILSPFTDFIYYHKLPQVYRDYDNIVKLNDYSLDNVILNRTRPLYRYLRSIIDGGYANLIYSAVSGSRGIDQLLELIDPQTCPSEFLPIYCESMGIEWFQDLVVSHTEGVDPYYYIRTFLSNVGEVYKRRGTESVVKYISKVLTSKDVKISYTRQTDSRILWVEIQVNSPEEVSQVAFNAEVIQRFISTQIPYYLTSRVLYILDMSDIKVTGYTGSAVTKVKRQTIAPSVLYPATADDFLYRIVNDEVYITLYIGDEGRLSVPRLIEDKPVVCIEQGAFAYNTFIEYVKLPDTLRVIE